MTVVLGATVLVVAHGGGRDRPAVDQAVRHPAGLVRRFAPSPAEGVLRDPDAHPLGTAVPGPAHPPHRGRRTALIWCRAGICFEDFEAHTGEIAAACYAREARIERSKRWAQLVQVNIVRRDTLAAHNVIASGLAAKVPRGASSPTTQAR